MITVWNGWGGGGVRVTMRMVWSVIVHYYDDDKE